MPRKVFVGVYEVGRRIVNTGWFGSTHVPRSVVLHVGPVTEREQRVPLAVHRHTPFSVVCGECENKCPTYGREVRVGTCCVMLNGIGVHLLLVHVIPYHHSNENYVQCKR